MMIMITHDDHGQAEALNPAIIMQANADLKLDDLNIGILLFVHWPWIMVANTE